MSLDKATALRLISVSHETRGRLEIYDALIRKWQNVKNLVAPGTLNHLWVRHFADSLQILGLKPDALRWADIGAGAGFPGLVIAIALADTPGALVYLVESDNRKCAFLRNVILETGARAEVVHARAEDVVGKLADIDVVTARAVAPLDKLVEIAAPLLLAGATGLFPKGRDYANELTRLSSQSTFHIEIAPSLTDASAGIVVIRSKEPRTPALET